LIEALSSSGHTRVNSDSAANSLRASDQEIADALSGTCTRTEPSPQQIGQLWPIDAHQTSNIDLTKTATLNLVTDGRANSRRDETTSPFQNVRGGNREAITAVGRMAHDRGAGSRRLGSARPNGNADTDISEIFFENLIVGVRLPRNTCRRRAQG